MMQMNSQGTIFVAEGIKGTKTIGCDDPLYCTLSIVSNFNQIDSAKLLRISTNDKYFVVFGIHEIVIVELVLI
jgi:hypothetical protein